MLTVQSSVQHSLLDLGIIHHIGSSLCEDELPRSGFKPIPVILHYWYAVLQSEREERWWDREEREREEKRDGVRVREGERQKDK